MSSDTTTAESARVDAGSAGLTYVSDENLGISRTGGADLRGGAHGETSIFVRQGGSLFAAPGGPMSVDKAETKSSTPNIEASPNPAREQSRSDPDLRIRQQEILAQLGVLSLHGQSLQELLDAAVRIAAEGLRAQLCKVLEYIPAENRFLMRAGVGWDPGFVGIATVGADLESPSGYAIRTGKPVISNHLENEERFTTPELLRVHGVRRAINVILQGDGSPFGVLEVDSRSEGEFTEQDIPFLQGAANILGMAIERQRYEHRLQAAVDRQEMLMKEINHRVKNSLQLVSSMFHLQAQAATDPALIQALQAASGRVTAVARVHERLYRDADVRVVDLSAYLTDVCHDLSEVLSPCVIDFKAPAQLRMGTDRAVLVALLVGELVTNAAKHAYAGAVAGAIAVRLDPKDANSALLTVRDDGTGLPPDFDLDTQGGFGMRIVRAFLQPTGAKIAVHRKSPGTEFVIHIPIDSVQPFASG